MSGLEPLIRALQVRHSRTFVDDPRRAQGARRYSKCLHDLGSTGPASLLDQRRDETCREPTRMRRRHAGATLDLIPDVPARYGREGDSRRQDVGLRKLSAARAEPAEDVTRGWYPLLRRLRKHTGVTRANRQGKIGGAWKTERRQTWSIVSRTDREHDVGMSQEEGIDDRVD